MSKSVKFGRFLIRSKIPITHEHLRILNRRDCSVIEMVRDKVIRGTWTIVELA